jgi:sugar phosphate isomerase/epimerase
MAYRTLVEGPSASAGASNGSQEVGVRSIALLQNAALDLEPPDFVSFAATTGCDEISLWTCAPPSLSLPFKAVSFEDLPEVMARLKRSGLRVCGVDHFPIHADTRIEDYAIGLSIGAELGARLASTAIYDLDGARAAATLGKFAALAATYGLSVGLEFTGLSAGCANIQKAAWFVDRVGADNLGLCIDALHLVRTGGAAQDVAALDARYLTVCQLSDGHGLHRSSDYLEECMNRALPGAGEFPLDAIVAALPEGTPIELEIPRTVSDDGVPLLAHVRDGVVSARRLLRDVRGRAV